MPADLLFGKARKVSLAGFLLGLGTTLAMGVPVVEPAFATEAVEVRARALKVPAETGLEDSAVTVEAAFKLSAYHRDFGGLSGIWVPDDGERLIAVSDKGHLWQAVLDHNSEGRLLGLGEWTYAEIPRLPDDPRGWRARDAEALAGDAQSLTVAYEGIHRLRRLPLSDLEAPPSKLPSLIGLGGPSNSGIEALAALEGGRLLAVAEGVGAWGGVGLSAWLIDGPRVDDLIYLQTPGFAPTGADRLGDTVYVVERQFSLLGGFRTNVLALPTADIRPDAKLGGDTLAAFRFGDLGENFEGIAARAAPDGRTLLYLIADDNFSLFQRTVLLQLSLPAEMVPKAAAAATVIK